MGNGYTGRLFEHEVLGECVWRQSQEYLPYRQALALVRECQPWDPADPGPRMASDLHATVCMALELEDWFQLRLYTAVGSPADRYHGVDGWVEWQGRVVTLDLTTDPAKGFAKADFLVRPEDMEGSALEELARQVAEKLLGASLAAIV